VKPGRLHSAWVAHAPGAQQLATRSCRAAVCGACSRAGPVTSVLNTSERAPARHVRQGGGLPLRGALALELRRLRAAERQERLRAAVEREQLDVAAMNDRAYRRFVRQSLMQRLGLLRGVRPRAGAGGGARSAGPRAPLRHPMAVSPVLGGAGRRSRRSAGCCHRAAARAQAGACARTHARRLSLNGCRC